MRIRRDISSIPARSASETWQKIVEIVTANDTRDRAQLEAAASIMKSLIADDHPASVPIVFSGGGPRVFIYLRYNEDAMEGGLSVDPLPSNPTAGDWRVTAPSDDDDVEWMNKSLKSRAPQFSVHAPGDASTHAEENQLLPPSRLTGGRSGNDELSIRDKLFPNPDRDLRFRQNAELSQAPGQPLRPQPGRGA